MAGRLARVNAACTDTLTLFTVDENCGHDGMIAAGVLPVFAGVAVHHGFTPYRAYGLAHQLCNGHHLRELAAVLDADPTQFWAADMSRLLAEINDTTRDARTNRAVVPPWPRPRGRSTIRRKGRRRR